MSFTLRITHRRAGRGWRRRRVRCLIGFSRATVTQWATREDEKGLFDFGTGSMTNLSDWIKAGWRVEGNYLVLQP